MRPFRLRPYLPLLPLALLVSASLDSPARGTQVPILLPPIPVAIHVDASQDKGEMRPLWRYYGADEPNYAPMPHGEKLLGDLGRIGPKPAYFRTHNLLTTGDGTPALKWGSTNAYTEDAQGRLRKLIRKGLVGAIFALEGVAKSAVRLSPAVG